MKARTILCTALIGAASVVLPAAGVSAATKPVHRSVAKRPHRPLVRVPRGWPKYVLVPKLKVKAPVESLDLSKKVPTYAPYRWTDVAWYNRGPRPGEQGRATVYGHLDSNCCPAVFYRLKDLKRGDIAVVQYKSGAPMRFRIMWSKVYDNAKLPMKFMFGPSRERGLVLMTCAGIYLRGSGYTQKLVVYARLLLPNGRLA